MGGLEELLRYLLDNASQIFYSTGSRDAEVQWYSVG